MFNIFISLFHEIFVRCKELIDALLYDSER